MRTAVLFVKTEDSCVVRIGCRRRYELPSRPLLPTLCEPPPAQSSPWRPLTVIPPSPQGLDDYVLDSVACSLSLGLYCRVESLVVQNYCQLSHWPLRRWQGLPIPNAIVPQSTDAIGGTVRSLLPRRLSAVHPAKLILRLGIKLLRHGGCPPKSPKIYSLH